MLFLALVIFGSPANAAELDLVSFCASRDLAGHQFPPGTCHKGGINLPWQNHGGTKVYVFNAKARGSAAFPEMATDMFTSLFKIASSWRSISL